MNGIFLNGLKRLLSGGASYLLIGLVGFVLVQNFRLKSVISDRDAARAERDQAIAEVQNKDSVIKAQSEQFLRRAMAEKEKDNAEQLIHSVPDSFDCQRSMPVATALEWLRQYEGSGAADGDD